MNYVYLGSCYWLKTLPGHPPRRASLKDFGIDGRSLSSPSDSGPIWAITA